MLKKIILLILGGSFLCAYLLAHKATDTREVITFASWGSKSEIEIIKPILNDFEKENPDIKVDFMHIPQNYFQKIHLLFASNTAPDVLFINNLYLPLYANAGLLEPMYADDNFYRKSLEALSWKNTLYAVPRDISMLVIYYNKDIFRAKKIQYPQDNWTFDEFIKTAQKLTGNGIFGISFEEDAMYYLPYLMSEGGGILSDDLSTIIINNPKSQKGLELYTSLRKKYHIAPFREESASATMAQMFLQQKLAMHLSGRWMVPKYRADADFNWDVVRFPKGDAGSVVPLDASGWAISKSSKHKDSAKRLVEFLSSKESSKKFTKNGLIVPARKDVAETTAFLDNLKPHNSRLFINIIDDAKPTPVSVDYKEIQDNLKGKFEKQFN